MTKQILLLDDDEHLLRSLRAALKTEDREVHVCTNPSGVVEDIVARGIGVVVVELEVTGLKADEFLREIRRRCPSTMVVVLTVNATVERAVEAMRLGVFEYRVKPVPVARVLEVVERAEGHRALLTPRPVSIPMPVAKVSVLEPGDPMTLEQAMEGPEQQVILRALTRHGWNRQATAEELGINRTTLYKKMRKHQLDIGEIEPS